MRYLTMGCVILAALSVGNTASAQLNGGYGTGSNPSSHGVGGYTTNQGTYVQPHQQTNPNGSTLDNYNTRGNYNPSNGQTGTRAPSGPGFKGL